MTTRKTRSGAEAPADPPPRPTRPEARRTGPIRGAGAQRSGPDLGGGANERDEGPLNAISEDVAQAVRVGYEVFSENLKRGREAANAFSQGEYRLGQVPQDAGQTLNDLGRLLKQLTDSSFDILYRLAEIVSTWKPPGPSDVPPFRSGAGDGADRSFAAPRALALAVRFSPPAIGRALTLSLERPQGQTSPTEIRASPLAAREGAAPPLTDVTFDFDIASGGLVATVSVPEDQAPGVYSGAVWAATQERPLGVLAIELAQ
jgi:hypothetical protein